MKKKGIRADRVYFCTTIFFAVLFLVMFIAMNHFNNELTEVNEDLLNTIDINRENYDNNLKELKDNYEIQLSEAYERYITLEHYQYYCEEILENVSIDNETMVLLAKCVQAEAGSYENHGTSQQMIARVILNRVASDKFPDTIEEVIYDNRGSVVQFSVAYNGALDSVKVTPETICNVYNAILFNSVDLPENVLYFYSESLVEDNWIKSLEVYDTVEGTVFAYGESEE